MRLKMAGIVLGVVGLAVTSIGMLSKTKTTKRDQQNEWLYCSQFRDDLIRETLEEFQREHPGVEITRELRSKIIREAFDKVRKENSYEL